MCDPKYDPTRESNQARFLGTVAGFAMGGPAGAAAGYMAGDAVQSGQDAMKAQAKASAIAIINANKAADQADQAFNRANGKQPDLAGLYSANERDSKGGISGTMLTGPQGVDPKTLMLGRNTLLGA